MIYVSAGIVVRDARVLLCQRKPGGANALKWEFPGGKLEPGETGEQALARELMEENGVDVRAVRLYCAERAGENLTVLFYFAQWLDGEAQLIDCAAAEWVRPEALTGYDLAPADRVVAERLASGDLEVYLAEAAR